jgi:hypothetical protein
MISDDVMWEINLNTFRGLLILVYFKVMFDPCLAVRHPIKSGFNWSDQPPKALLVGCRGCCDPFLEKIKNKK